MRSLLNYPFRGVAKECDGTCPCDNKLNLQNIGGCYHCEMQGWDPVCSTEGNTYRNLCYANCRYSNRIILATDLERNDFKNAVAGKYLILQFMSIFLQIKE